jgi:hypothetical protein
MDSNTFLIITTGWQFLLMQIFICALQFGFYKFHKISGIPGLVVMVFILVTSALLIQDIDYFKIHLILQFPLFVVILTKMENRLRSNDSVPGEKRENDRVMSRVENENNSQP